MSHKKHWTVCGLIYWNEEREPHRLRLIIHQPTFMRLLRVICAEYIHHQITDA